MTYRKAPSCDEIDAALKAAEQGKGRKLAILVKSFSQEDLAAAFGAVGESGLGFFTLARALNFAAGRKEYRAQHAAAARNWRKEWKATR